MKRILGFIAMASYLISQALEYLLILVGGVPAQITFDEYHAMNRAHAENKRIAKANADAAYREYLKRTSVDVS